MKKILIIDDKNFLDILEHAFKKLNMKNYKFYQEWITYPTKDIEEVLLKRIKGSTNYNINEIDLIYLDLEFEIDEIQKDNITTKDLLGAEGFLPMLRKNFPWIPIIAFSKFFRTFLEISLTASYPFDGILPKDCIINILKEGLNLKFISEQDIIQLHRRAELNTFYRILSTNIKTDTLLKDNNIFGTEDVNKRFKEINKLLKYCFYFAKEIKLIPIKSGYSGAETYKLRTKKNDFFSYWFIKISKDKVKLQKEIDAHNSLIINGIGYGLSLPLLYNIVVAFGKTSCIIYQYASEAINGNELYVQLKNDQNGSQNFINKIKNLLDTYYSKYNIISKSDSIDQLINNILNFTDIINRIEDIDIKDKVKIIINKLLELDLKPIKYNECFVHGDLHLGNMMFGRTDVLIDFANAKKFPIAFDIAKLAFNFLLNNENLRENEFPSINKKTELSKLLSPLIKEFLVESDDEILFNLCLLYEMIK